MSTLELVRSALAGECGINPAAVNEDTDLMKDLKIDSLDLINASYAIQKACGVELPLEEWIAEEYGESGAVDRRFMVGSICAYIDAKR
jgi:acyl carrier protein